jgi:bacteriorhodopsin
MITALFYLITALLYSTDLTTPYDITTLKYIKWLVTTPILITQVGILERIEISNIFLICSFDVLTICAGFAAHYSQVPSMFYPLFAFGCMSWFIVMKSLLYRTFKFYSNKPPTSTQMNNWVFTILVVGMTCVWNMYPVVAILHYTNIFDDEADLIANTVIDVIGKGVFGLVLIGAKEVEEGIESILASLSKSITRVHPTTLEPVKEEEDAVIVHIDEKRPRKPRRQSIYLYTPPTSYKSLVGGGSQDSYSSASNRTVLPPPAAA